MPQGATRVGEGKVQTDREIGPRANAFNRVCGWGALRFPDWNQTCQFKAKEQGFGKLQGGLV